MSEPDVKLENSESDETSSSSDSETQVLARRSVTINQEAQVRPISPRSLPGPSQSKSIRTPVPQERVQRASDVEQASQTVKPKTKTPSKLNMAGQLLKTAVPSSEEVLLDRWQDYYEMKNQRKQAKEASKDLKRGDRSRNPPEIWSKL